MHIVVIVIVLFIVTIFGLMKCEEEFPTQNYYKKDVTNEEYKEAIKDCESARYRAIDMELYVNPKNYSIAGSLGEYAEDQCFREKGFIKKGEIAQIPASVEVFKTSSAEPENTELKERVTTEDPVVRDEIFYLPNEDKPFTGRYETYYPNGNKKGVAHIKNGKFDGLMTLWDENGRINSERNIKNGVEIPINKVQKKEQNTNTHGGFGSFRTEAEAAKTKLECPNSVDADITPALYDGAGALYGCILGKMETVKWFINEIPSSNRVSNVKFLWNDWFTDMGYGLHPDKEEAQKALKTLIKLYAPEKSNELNKVFFGNNSKIVTSAKFTIKYTFDRGQAIDERMIVVTEKLDNHQISKTANVDLIEADNIVKASDPTLTTHLQEKTSIGLVKVSIHNFCTPMLDVCESWVVLKYRDQIIKKIQSGTSRKLSKDNLAKKGKFITIESATGGNCSTCEGIYVFKLENEKLILLGYFFSVENNFLIGLYDVLEFNSLTSHAAAPLWNVYYKNLGDNIILDFEKTCNTGHYDYNKVKNSLIKNISEHKGKPANDPYNEIESSILHVLSFAKWCGFENDYLTLVSMIRDSSVLDYEKLTILNEELNKVIKGNDANTLATIKAGNK